MELVQLLKTSKELEVVDEIFSLSRERSDLKDKVVGLDEGIALAEKLSGIEIDFSKLKSNALDFRAFTTDVRSLEAINAALRQKKILHEVVTKTLPDKSVVAFLAFEKGKGALAEEALKNFKVGELDLSNSYLTSTPEHVLKKLRAEREGSAKMINSIDNALTDISSKHYSKIAGIVEMLGIEYARANVGTNFKKTEKTFIIEGWIPKNRRAELEGALKGSIGERFYIEELREKELAPTLVNRPKILEPFGYLMDFYSVQRSDEIDPTIFLVITLAISYGIMVSDVIYGLMSLVLAHVIVKKTDPDGLLNNVARIWRLFSIPIIFFGFVSNVFMGYSLPWFNGIKIFDWKTDVPMLILFTILVGITEIIIGQVLGFFNKMRHHEMKLAVSKLLAIPALICGTVAIGGAFFHAFDPTLTLYCGIVTAVSFLGAAVLSGIEAAELPGLIAHPMSYSRLLGFGLASVVLSELINMAFTPSLSHGILAFIVFAVIFIVLHSMNMILSIFEGVVQGARLDFVEVFSKFYIGNGVKFKPYHFRRHYTKD
jgi:V/A-type H+-transporting ATPase subunit I